MSVIAVVGVGAVGGAIAARLCAVHRDDVVLCVRTPFEALVVESPTGTRRITPRLCATPDAVQPVSWVLLATKAHHTAGAAAWLQALTDAHTTVAILQNGVEHIERVAPYVNGATLLPVVVECPATRVAPGRIVQREPAHLLVPATEAGRAFAQLFAGTDVGVTVTPDFVTAAWRKLCLNVAGGAVTALTDCPQEVMRRPDVAQVARDLIQECVTVGRAEGADLDESLVEEIVVAMVEGPAEAGTSMLTDRRAGRLLEADARNGAVARIGARHRIATPLNRAVTALLTALNQT
ncbi:MAG: 2-dehydropantoate 2-reductase [Candidatus Tectomicrobia bacterium]|uniref:2-dehydropantoate 2-reductase n=1 Tax=Tectimicrobiota bacterium TaxID=2528274 RepID=A0A937VYQ4_UNCTE|nr:2-dehydropantoate 2-reductase [Candidatus Tectomicrobia bacterium]